MNIFLWIFRGGAYCGDIPDLDHGDIKPLSLPITMETR